MRAVMDGSLREERERIATAVDGGSKGEASTHAMAWVVTTCDSSPSGIMDKIMVAVAEPGVMASPVGRVGGGRGFIETSVRPGGIPGGRGPVARGRVPVRARLLGSNSARLLNNGWRVVGLVM